MTQGPKHFPGEQAPIKAWVSGVEFEDAAREQLENVAKLPILGPHIAVMPDVHAGIGATVGSVIPTRRALIPAAVGVDIGCGMKAVKLDMTSHQLPEQLDTVRKAIEQAVPHGFSSEHRDHHKGGWVDSPKLAQNIWRDKLSSDFDRIVARHSSVAKDTTLNQLGTLGGGNHFVEICLDETDHVWVMLHSGSRGVGNRIGSYFIDQAKRDSEARKVSLPHRDLAWLEEGSELFNDYWFALDWAQRFAKFNREVMLDSIFNVLRANIPAFKDARVKDRAIDCHHNYAAVEHHFGEKLYVTRKGAVRAGPGEMGIIPGSMGARSYIVRGKGNSDSYCSCSHGAGRRMSRGEAKRRYTVEDHAQATAHVECRKDAGVIDETPMAYKDIDHVLAAQSDLVEVAATLRQIVCVKG